MSREYVDRIDVNGTIGYVKETITGEGAPTESTVGFVGQRYVDAADVKEYICAGISVTDGEKRYMWQAGGTMMNVGDPPKILWLERGAPTLYTKGEYGMYAFDKHFGLLYAYSGNFPADDTDDGLHHLWALSPGYSNYNYPPTKNSYGEWGQLWADYSACELYMCVGRDIDLEDKKVIYLWRKVSGAGGSLTEEDYAAIAQEAAKLVDVPAIDDTLKVDGAAADAAKVGEELSQLSDAIAAKLDTDKVFDIVQKGSPDYTNQIPLSTDADGNVFGYISESTIHGDGSVETGPGHSGYVTGFIPVKLGDTIRIKDPSKTEFTTSVSFALYKNKTYIQNGVGKTLATMLANESKAFGEISVDGNVVTWKLVNLNNYYWNNFTYMRIMTLSADSVVTINEELIESVKDALVLKPSITVTKDSLDLELSDKPLFGKTAVGFGDSIFGYKRDSSSVLSVAANTTGATVYNVGFGGCRMSTHPTSGYAAFSMYKLADAVTSGVWTEQDAQASSGSSYFPEQVELLKSIDFNKVDIVLIHYGSNDFTGGNGVAVDNADNPYDCNTFIGAFRYSVEKLLTAYPHLQIYVSLPTYCYYSNTNDYPETHTNVLGKYIYEYIDALRNAASEYNLSVIDGFYGLGINKFNVNTLTSDGAHHNEAGRKRLGEFIAGHLIGRQNSGKSGVNISDVIAALPVYNGEVV